MEPIILSQPARLHLTTVYRQQASQREFSLDLKYHWGTRLVALSTLLVTVRFAIAKTTKKSLLTVFAFSQ